MQVFFLVTDISLGGGGERVTIGLANQFVADRKEVTIVSIVKPVNSIPFPVDSRVKVQHLDMDLQHGIKLINKLKSCFKLVKFFKSYRDSLILLGIGTYPTILVSLLPRRQHIKTVGCQHNSYSALKHIWKVLRWLLYRRLNAVISLTRTDVYNLRKHNQNVWVIPNSVPFFPKQPAALQNNSILAVGRIDFGKGYDLMLKVFERFASINKDWNLRIIGEGPLRNNIEQLISEKGLENRVTIVPFTDQIEVEYLNASIYLMTSRTEGMPMVLLEAQACGLPIISFNCETGPSEIITNSENGYLIEYPNTEEMCTRLLELCENPLKRKIFGQNSRQSVKRYFPENIIGKWNELFTHLQPDL